MPVIENDRKRKGSGKERKEVVNPVLRVSIHPKSHLITAGTE